MIDHRWLDHEMDTVPEIQVSRDTELSGFAAIRKKLILRGGEGSNSFSPFVISISSEPIILTHAH